MGTSKSRPAATASARSSGSAPASGARRGRSNADMQERLRATSSGPSVEASGSRGSGSVGGTAWSGSAQRGPVSVEGSVGAVGASGTLSNARDRRGRQHASVGASVGGSVATGQVRVGSEDNNARLGFDIGFGFSASSTVGDADKDGVPERSIDLSIGPFTIGWTTEDILSVMSADRYHQLRKQAEAEVRAKFGRVGDGGEAGRMLRTRLKQLVDAEVKRSGGKKGR